MNLTAVSLHEAAHAFCFLSLGTRVEEIVVSEHGGHCKASCRDWPAVVALMAGAVAESLWCGSRFEDALSLEDATLARRLEVQFSDDMGRSVTHRDRQQWREQATRLLLNNEPNVRLFAAELRDRKRMSAADLAAECYRAGSALRQFAGLYPSPAPKPSAPVAPSTGIPGDPAAVWSDKYGCFLSRVPPKRAAPRSQQSAGDLGDLIRGLLGGSHSGFERVSPGGFW